MCVCVCVCVRERDQNLPASWSLAALYYYVR